MGFDWRSTLATVAPTIATALGGPLAGMAVKVAADALGIEADESELQQALATGDPEVLAKLKQANQDFLVRMKELGIREEELVYKDRADARQMYEKTGTILVPLLSIIIISAFLGMVWYILSGEAKVESALAGTLIGYVSAKAEQVVAFLFGSSQGSKEKTAAMAEAMKKAAR